MMVILADERLPDGMRLIRAQSVDRDARRRRPDIVLRYTEVLVTAGARPADILTMLRADLES